MSLKEKIEETGVHLREYYETVTELKKLQAVEKASSAISYSSAMVAVLCVFSLALFFASFAIALLISENSQNLYTGFLYVTGFYVLAGILLYIFRNRIVRNPVRNYFIKFFLNERED